MATTMDSPIAPATPPALTLDDVHLDDTNQFDIWDHRESAVGNADVWAAACKAHKATPAFAAGIPHVMHQIWIGSREPPCVWLDTWRHDYMHAFGDKPGAPSWSYKLWDNAAAKHMPMQNRDIFDAEAAPQCQADILRLEILYEYGGVYIDADIVSTQKDLRPALEQARTQGFMITYEPDTKDKPYSILGNSIIACTPRHPLILMLMAYIKKIYPLKRAHYGVEWVTGPLTYTKVLVHTGMPVYIPQSKDFYPAFHYVPNPSAIDVTQFDSYCFQFGYTCSGLSDWVRRHNTCRHAHSCTHHAGIDYPLGRLRQFPDDDKELCAAVEPSAVEVAIPNTVHQIWLGKGVPPTRWTNTWQNLFCESFGYTYELWTLQRLKDEIGSFFCANLYASTGSMTPRSAHLLALEILHARGGHYIPLSTTFAASGTDRSAETALLGDSHALLPSGVRKRGGMLAAAKGGALAAIRVAYEGAEFTAEPHGEFDDALSTQLVVDMGFGDDVVMRASYSDASRFLGAGVIVHAVEAVEAADGMSASSAGSAAAALTWAYDCQVPLVRCRGGDDAVATVAQGGRRAVVLTDDDFSMFSSLVNEVPGIMYHLEQDGKEWDFIVLNVEWEADSTGLDVYPASCGTRVATSHYLGYIVHEDVAHTMRDVSIESVLQRFDSGRVFIASEKSMNSQKVASIFRCVPVLQRVCDQLAGGYTPKLEREYDEECGDMVKAFRDGQIAFEIQVDDSRNVMFRSWSNACIDCECRFRVDVGGADVEFLRCYDGGRVLCDVSGEHVSM